MSRQISATLFRATGIGTERKHVWIRHYSWIDTAFPRTVGVAISSGQVGDVVEFAFIESGLQLGTVKVVGAYRVETEWSPLVKRNPKLKALLRGI